MNDISRLMKQAQQLQTHMTKVHENLGKTTKEGTSGGGTVVVVLSGDFQLKKITIHPTAIEGNDTDLLEDLITSAFQDAWQKVHELRENELGKGMEMFG